MKSKLEWLYKLIIVITSCIGVCLNFKLFTVKGALIYYTVQSNLLCFIFYFVILILYILKKLKKNSMYYVFKGMVTMAMTITMVVFQLLLSSNGTYAGHEFTSLLVHLVVPLLTIFDYIIFGEKGNLKNTYPFIWTASLIFYLVFDVIYVCLGGKFNNLNNYPYFFLNIDKYGFIGVMINCLIIYILFLLFGIIVQRLDQKLKKINQKLEY